MNWKKITAAIIMIIMLALSACSLQFSGPVQGNPVDTAVAQTMSAKTNVANIVATTIGGDSAVATAVAKTLSAQTDVANLAAATLAAMATNTPVFTPTPSATPLPTLTFTPVLPMVSVSVATNCRTGPGKVYDMVGALPVGQTAEVLGRAADSQYWLIRNPSNPSTVCWLWGYYATVTGNTSGLPIATPPPTPTPAPGFTVEFVSTTSCGGQFAFRFKLVNIGSLTWESVRIVVTDNTSASTFTHTRDSFRGYTGCPSDAEQADLMPGENGVVSNVNPGQLGYNPAGHSITAVFTLCSANGLGGTCVSQTISFTP